MHKAKKISYFAPSALVVITIVLFNLLPGIYLLNSGWKEDLYFEYSLYEYQLGVIQYVTAVSVFLATFVACSFLLGFRLKNLQRRVEVNIFDRKSTRADFEQYGIYSALTLVGVILTAIYFVDGGYQKLLLFGSNLDSWAFRLIGYDDRSRFLIAGLEASRRVLLPLGVSYLFVVFRLGGRTGVAGLLVLGALFQILGAAMTLDRAPVLLFFMMFVFVSTCLGMTFLKLVRMSAIALLLILLVAGVTTFLQYNIRSFSLADVWETGWNFLFHRTVLVPSIASVELSFIRFPDDTPKLFLQFSRLTALFGGTYVGTEDLDSIFVTPVGIIGDVWRNFGMTGIVISAAVLAAYFRAMDKLVERASPIGMVVHSFNALSLAFYFIFGVLFSQGVLFQMLLGFAILAAEVANRRSRAAVRGRIGYSTRI